ncbi:outer membrane beta-barrel protein [Hydrogenivirga sp.]
MKKKLLLTAVLALAGSSLAQEKTITLKLSQPLELYGGVSAGYFYTTNEGSKDNDDVFQVTNVIIGLKGETGDAMKLGFDIAVGQSYLGTIDSPLNGSAGQTDRFGLVWGYLSLKPADKLSLDAGLLTTNVGYELADTYTNPNVTFGNVWGAQPFIYPGARVTFDVTDGISLYAEYNKEYSGDNFAVGSLGEIGAISYGLTYFDYNDTDGTVPNRSLVDLVLGMSLGNIDLGLNADFHKLDDSSKTGNDDTAYGVAVYVTPNFGNLSVPVRAEYFDSGDTGIYVDKKGYTFTVTPTFKPAENTFVRAELTHISADNKIFNNKDNKTTLAVELGFTF